MKDATLETINKVNLNKRVGKGLDLNIQSSLGGVSIFKNNWAVCDVEELTQMIEELTQMREAIEEVTGCKF